MSCLFPTYYNTLVEENPYNIISVPTATKEAQLIAVKKNPFILDLLINDMSITPDTEVQLAAVEKEPFSIQYIYKPCVFVQLAAVQKNPVAIRYILNPPVAVQLAAVSGFGEVIKWIAEPRHPDVEMAAVKNYPHSLKYITFPSFEVQKAAYNLDHTVVKWCPCILYSNPIKDCESNDVTCLISGQTILHGELFKRCINNHIISYESYRRWKSEKCEFCCKPLSDMCFKRMPAE